MDPSPPTGTDIPTWDEVVLHGEEWHVGRPQRGVKTRVRGDRIEGREDLTGTVKTTEGPVVGGG